MFVQAVVAELVDAWVLKTCDLCIVRVRVPPAAPLDIQEVKSMITVLLHYAERKSRVIRVFAAMKLMDLAIIHDAQEAEILEYSPSGSRSGPRSGSL